MRLSALLFLALVTPAAAPAVLCSSDVIVSISEGRASVTAQDASASDVLEAWSRAGRTAIVNGELLRNARLTLQLVDVPEEQALDLILRPAGGYVARRRSAPEVGASSFDRVVVLAVSSLPAPTTPEAPPSSPPSPTTTTLMGAERLVGPDGTLIVDDQEDAPAPAGFSRGDEPDGANPSPSAPRP